AGQPERVAGRGPRYGGPQQPDRRHVRDRLRASATAGWPSLGARRLRRRRTRPLGGGEVLFCRGRGRRRRGGGAPRDRLLPRAPVVGCRGGGARPDRRRPPRPVHDAGHFPPLLLLRRAERGQGRLVRVPGLRGRVAAGMELWMTLSIYLNNFMNKFIN